MKTTMCLLGVILLAGCDPEPTPVTPTQLPPGPTVTATATATTAPAVVGSPTVTEGDVTQLMVNGMTILVKRVPGAELAAANLYIRGGVRNWGAANAGVEDLAVSVAASGGTEKLERDAFARKLASLGSDLGAGSNNDYSVFAAKALTPQLDATFGMMCDAFLTPAMPASQIDLGRQQMLSRLRHEQESPDGKLSLLVHELLFKGHPYENRAVGTMDSVSKLTAAQLKEHLVKLREGSRLLLVVVGDVDAAHIADLAKQKLGALPRGNYKDAPLPALSFSKSRVEVTNAALPTTYVSGTFSTPSWRDADFYAAMVAMEHLGFKMFEEVRTKRNLSYAPKAYFRWAGGIPIGQLYVTAVDPNTTIKVMFDEVTKVQSQPLSVKQLEAAKSTLLTDTLMSNETTDGQAASLARAQLLGGDWRISRTLLEKVKAVTADQVKLFANKYIQHLQVEIMGNTKVDTELFTR